MSIRFSKSPESSNLEAVLRYFDKGARRGSNQKAIAPSKNQSFMELPSHAAFDLCWAGVVRDILLKFIHAIGSVLRNPDKSRRGVG